MASRNQPHTTEGEIFVTNLSSRRQGLVFWRVVPAAAPALARRWLSAQYLEDKRAALNAYADHIAKIVGGDQQ